MLGCYRTESFVYIIFDKLPWMVVAGLNLKKEKERGDEENRSSEHISQPEIIYLKFLLNKVKCQENSGLRLKQPQDTSKPAQFPHVSTLKLTAINGKPPHLAKHRGPPATHQLPREQQISVVIHT